MNSSKFNIMRALIAFCHIDGKVVSEEKKWITERYHQFPFTDDQKEQLLQDLISPTDLNKIIPLITKPSDRSFLLDQMRLIAHIDDFSEEEKKVIESYRSIILKEINLDELEDLIASDEHGSYHEDEVYKLHNKASLFEKIHRIFQKLLNPLNYKYPED